MDGDGQRPDHGCQTATAPAARRSLSQGPDPLPARRKGCRMIKPGSADRKASILITGLELDIRDAIEIRLHPVPEALWKSLSRGQFASRELYRLRLQAEHA